MPRHLSKPTPKQKLARKGAEHASKLPFGDIAKGPLEIFISVNQQRLHFYSDGVHVADAPVATGVPGHLTPLGVFSVIQRDRYHHSNIYSDAPMPYMERITWSGVALHEGVGLGHPASHGCIRMPHDFAARLWMLPTMGMRVIIARPELRPLAFADPHLFVHKERPPTPSTAPIAALATAQKAALRTDVIGDPAAGEALGAPAQASAKADPEKNALSAPKTNSTTPEKSDFAAGAAANTAPASAAIQPADAAAAANATGRPAAHQTDGPGQATEPALAEIAKQAAIAATHPAKPPESTPSPAPDSPPNQTAAPNAAAGTAPIGMASAPATPGASADSVAEEDIPLPPFKPAKIAHGSGPIAIFISRKTGKIYVRQNFTALFDAPVKIEHPDEPVGTHVFTAMDYLPDHSTFRWTVVTMPAAPPKEVEHWKYVTDYYGRLRRKRVEERIAEPPAATPQEALARIEVPPDVIEQISQLIVPGSSLIVSDQGLGPETGAGTDFIVLTR